MNTIAKKHAAILNTDEVTNPRMEVKESISISFKIPRKRNFTQVDLWRIRRNTKPVTMRAYLSV